MISKYRPLGDCQGAGMRKLLCAPINEKARCLDKLINWKQNWMEKLMTSSPTLILCNKRSFDFNTYCYIYWWAVHWILQYMYRWTLGILMAILSHLFISIVLCFQLWLITLFCVQTRHNKRTKLPVLKKCVVKHLYMPMYCH